MVNQSQHYGGVSQVPGVTLSWGKELKKLSAPWSLCWQGAEKVSEDGFLLSFGNPLILAVSSFSILGWIWFVFIKFSLFMFFLYFQLIPLFSLFVYFVSFKTDFMGMKKCCLPGRIRMICAYGTPVDAASSRVLFCWNVGLFTPWWMSACLHYKLKLNKINSRNNYLIARQLLPELNNTLDCLMTQNL